MQTVSKAFLAKSRLRRIVIHTQLRKDISDIIRPTNGRYTNLLAAIVRLKPMICMVGSIAKKKNNQPVISPDVHRIETISTGISMIVPTTPISIAGCDKAMGCGKG
jgi:hypothetical protein